MVIKGMDAQQLQNVATQLNVLLNQMGVAADFTRGGSLAVSSKDRGVLEAIEAKVREVEKSSGELLANPEAYLRLGNYYYAGGQLDVRLPPFGRRHALGAEVLRERPRAEREGGEDQRRAGAAGQPGRRRVVSARCRAAARRGEC